MVLGRGWGHRAGKDTWLLCLRTCDTYTCEPKLEAVELSPVCSRLPRDHTLTSQQEPSRPEAELGASQPYQLPLLEQVT